MILITSSGCAATYGSGTVIGVNAGYQGANLAIGYQEYKVVTANEKTFVNTSTEEDISANGIKRKTHVCIGVSITEVTND